MNWPYELQIGWRYTRAGRAGRRNGFISFISGVSMLGIALGVAALIIVLSVMNGFQKEVRDRMLSVIAHIEVMDAQGAALTDWQATAANVLCNLHVVLHHGRNSHHISEAIFKATARALRMAVEADPRVSGVPSTKGTLT